VDAAGRDDRLEWYEALAGAGARIDRVAQAGIDAERGALAGAEAEQRSIEAAVVAQASRLAKLRMAQAGGAGRLLDRVLPDVAEPDGLRGGDGDGLLLNRVLLPTPKRVSPTNSPTAAREGGRGPEWFEAKLEQLKDLFERGLLTASVYEAKQVEVVDAMESARRGDGRPRVGRPDGLDDTSGLTASVLCQYGGKGEFMPVWLELTAAGDLRFRTAEGGPTMRAVDLAGCSAGRPRKARSGHPHTLRLDAAESSAQVAAKFVFSFASPSGLQAWLRWLAAPGRGSGSSSGAVAVASLAVGSPPAAEPSRQLRRPLTAEARCQYEGKGSFLPVALCLKPGGDLELRERGERDRLLRLVSCVGCAAGAPKSSRKGHPHCLRLDVVDSPAQGAGKFVLSLSSVAEQQSWLHRLAHYAGMDAAEASRVAEAADADTKEAEEADSSTDADADASAEQANDAAEKPKPSPQELPATPPPANLLSLPLLSPLLSPADEVAAAFSDTPRGRILGLKERQLAALREECYEDCIALRDQIRQLERSEGPPPATPAPAPQVGLSVEQLEVAAAILLERLLTLPAGKGAGKAGRLSRAQMQALGRLAAAVVALQRSLQILSHHRGTEPSALFKEFELAASVRSGPRLVARRPRGSPLASRSIFYGSLARERRPLSSHSDSGYLRLAGFTKVVRGANVTEVEMKDSE
jgi:hypothetical protein